MSAVVSERSLHVLSSLLAGLRSVLCRNCRWESCMCHAGDRHVWSRSDAGSASWLILVRAERLCVISSRFWHLSEAQLWSWDVQKLGQIPLFPPAKIPAGGNKRISCHGHLGTS